MTHSILVVGGAGFIGSHMVAWLHRAGLRVAVADDLSSGPASAVGAARLHVGDIGDPGFAMRVLSAEKPDAVMHFAGSIQVGESIVDPAKYYRNNLLATQVLLDAMRVHGVHHGAPDHRASDPGGSRTAPRGRSRSAGRRCPGREAGFALDAAISGAGRDHRARLDLGAPAAEMGLA